MATAHRTIPLFDNKAQHEALKPRLTIAFEDVLSRGNFVMGKEVEAFEREWAEYCQAKYCIGVSSCTDALFLALKALRLNDDVTTTPLTFFATTQAIMANGWLPRFRDVSKETGNLVYGTGTDLTGPTLLVHLYGRECKVLNPNNHVVIEDAAQSHGLPLRHKAACHSFYPTKNLGAFGQAGAVVTNDEGLAQAVREFRNYGERERFVHHAITGNHRMDEIQAAVLRVKLPHLDRWNARRRELAEVYYNKLWGLAPWVTLPLWPTSDFHNFHIFAIRSPHRDDLAKYLAECGVGTAVRYPVPMHKQPVMWARKHHPGLGDIVSSFCRQEGLEEAEAWCREVLTLPMYPELPEADVRYICERIVAWVERGH